MNTDELFSGKIVQEGICTYLENQQAILMLCPAEFREYNRWTEAAQAFFAAGPREEWRWTAPQEAVRKRQRECMMTIMLTHGLRHEEKLRILCWMLSVVLAEPPRFTPGQRGDIFQTSPSQPFSAE